MDGQTYVHFIKIQKVQNFALNNFLFHIELSISPHKIFLTMGTKKVKNKKNIYKL